jgi:hypothetical protein
VILKYVCLWWRSTNRSSNLDSNKRGALDIENTALGFADIGKNETSASSNANQGIWSNLPTERIAWESSAATGMEIGSREQLPGASTCSAGRVQIVMENLMIAVTARRPFHVSGNAVSTTCPDTCDRQLNNST